MLAVAGVIRTVESWKKSVFLLKTGSYYCKLAKTQNALAMR